LILDYLSHFLTGSERLYLAMTCKSVHTALAPTLTLQFDVEKPYALYLEQLVR